MLSSGFYNQDCIDGMVGFPDNFFDLAIVDPPYGIGEDGAKNHTRSCLADTTKFTPKKWDSETPGDEYFIELFRVSKHQIIWGGNYFLDNLGSTPCMIVWDKDNGNNDFADCELAWTSFQTAVRKFTFRWQGMLQQNMKHKEVRIHPTQKPIPLYQWLLMNYAKPGWTILDTHVGSGSSLIACEREGFTYWGFEIDKEYYDAAQKRIERELAQFDLFKKKKST